MKIKELNKNYIPILANEMLKNWRQPNRNEILVDDKNALMKKESFDQLQDYPEKYHWIRSEGKMCRNGNIFYWYGYHLKENMVSLHFREIILID